MSGPRARIWDVPTRVFHWSLVACFAGAWFSDDARYLDPHVFLGYTMGGLIVFRLVWGLVGTRWARFASFRHSPLAGLRYLRAMLRRRHGHHVGHNPAGAWSIYLLLTLAAIVVISGIAALGGEKRHGPLAGSLSFATGDIAHDLHELVAWAMLGVVVLHVLGVVAGSIADRENLARAMITGSKRTDDPAHGVAAKRIVAIVLVLAIAAGAAAWFRPYFGATAATYRPFVGAALPMDKAWEDECGSCHLAYHPSTLPGRSWKRMLVEQDRHFGEDLSLSEDTIEELGQYAAANAAEQHATPLAWKMATRVPAGEAPLRISETRYWKHQHEDIAPAVWKQVKAFDCGGCHLDADAGTFEPGAIVIGSGTVNRQKGGKAG